jgi:hypothetical protein
VSRQVHAFDGNLDHVQAPNEAKDPRGWNGVDFNRQWPANWSTQQLGAGDFPFSEHEMRLFGGFITDHPKIFGIMVRSHALTHHVPYPTYRKAATN